MKAESYQKLIRRDERIRKTVGITHFFEFFELFPLFNQGIMTGGKRCFLVLFELITPVCFLHFRLFHVVHGAVVVKLS